MSGSESRDRSGLINSIPVVVVGAGPTGLTAATLLAGYGIETLVLERWDGIYPQPRAVHLDGEIRRILARLGVDADFEAISRPALGLRLIDPDMRVLAQFDRDPAGGSNGYPEANLFDQPELEAILRANVLRYPGITLRGNAEVVGMTQENGCVRVDFTDRVTGTAESVLAGYVLGCDGANSVARAAIGATMRDLNFAQRWLVVDVETAADFGEWEGVHQVCDPVRAATYMRIGTTRYRWEFQLRPGETAAYFNDSTNLHPLIAPWTGNTPPDALRLVRVAEYTFRAQLADRWRCGRIFLLGDAAHLTPPFIGQGMGAGLRDAANLAWKLAGVLADNLPASVLDTYEIERKPHAHAMIRLAKFTGRAMTDGGELGNLLRRLIAPRLHRLPGFTELVTDGQTPPLHRSETVVAHRFYRGLAGKLVPNTLLDGRRFDDIAAGRFAIITVVEPTPEQRREIEQRGGVIVIARPVLRRWLGRRHGALVRPDGTVQRTSRQLSDLIADLPGCKAPASDDYSRVSSPDA
ncbi:bifunctional 3-(3-hydroxy-phenyl)propionate/3-hydroxycinnamic acid hydroxylase [Nocardia sp. NPDC052112]|uniref:bifunctional 3-(3-hydroxy-phenyl)propionate/3-hydroxycinnamic acid hydroxylase MhpA n=1 Tax=Nocardia sp. NPDC052112 TaxID=3155646 RepID=UPI003413FE04